MKTPGVENWAPPDLIVRDATSFDGQSCNFCHEPVGRVKVVESRVTQLTARMCGKCVLALRAQTG